MEPEELLAEEQLLEDSIPEHVPNSNESRKACSVDFGRLEEGEIVNF